MKLYTIALASIICLNTIALSAEKLVYKTYANNPRSKSDPTGLLLIGIRESKPAYVERALKMGVDLNIRIGPYADTPLMSAVRIYCTWLVNQLQGNNKSIIKRFLASELLGFGTGVGLFLLLSKYNPNNNVGFLTNSQFSWLLGTSVSFFIWLITALPLASTGPGKVVELLIKAEPNINARNKEGLDARDILRAHFLIAYQLKDEDWFRFLYTIMHRSGIPTTPEDVMDDISEQYNEFINQQMQAT